MRLTRIRIKGFKSFADETELQFDRGVGVIVWLVLKAIIEAYAGVAQQYQ